MSNHNLDDLGPADLTIGPLRVWVHGREFPDDQSEWDGNWLRITAHCTGNGASVRIHGALMMSQGLASWVDDLTRIQETLEGSAHLGGDEPNLAVALGPVERTGDLGLVVEITPDHLAQNHEFRRAVDQSYLPAFIAEAKRLLVRFPVRGTSAEPAPSPSSRGPR